METDETAKVPCEAADGDPQDKYPGKKVVIPVVFAVCLALFLASLDRTIIGVAVPTISNDFRSFEDIAWYESAYLLTFAALQLPMGKFYTFFPAKWVFVINVVIFAIGSVICAAAPTSTTFIVGRAISGIGGAGCSIGASIIFVDLLPLHKRPKYQGFLGATFGLASIAGPLLGGVFTNQISWRWCFWINLPVAGAALAVLLVVLPNNPPARKDSRETFKQRVMQFDPLGTSLLTPGLILFLLALQWGGADGSWSSTKVVVTLVLGLVLLLAFCASQAWVGENGTVPPRLIRQRTIAAASVASLGFGSALIIVTFYVPIWYQAIQGLTPIEAGYRMLAYFLTTVFFVIGSGLLVSAIGYYTPVFILGTAIMMVGSGLFTTLSVTTSNGQAIGYQVVTGVGLGLCLAQPMNAVQTVLTREDIPTGLTIVNFANFLGGTIFVSVSQGIFSHTLATELARDIPDLDVSSALNHGATDLAKSVPQDQVPLLLAAYSKGIDNIFYLVLAVSGLAFVAAWFLEWKTVKKPEELVDSTPDV